MPIKFVNKKDLQKLRRIAIAHQGLANKNTFGQGICAAKDAIAHIGYVQIDTISVVQRAHHHVFWSRVPSFKTSMTNQLLSDRSIFEYWTHAAAFIPMPHYRYTLPYKSSVKAGKRHWFKNPDKKLMAALIKRIESEGPIRSRDLEQTKKRSSGGWGNWKPAKRALEQLYFQGDLMVSARDGFQKSYDLPERVIPPGTDTTMPTSQEFASHLLDQQLTCHGMVTLKGITYQRRDPGLRDAMKTLVRQKLSAQELVEIEIADGSKFLCPPNAIESMPRAGKTLKILSPFDNMVIQRERLKALFNFDYQIECYVPQAKRQHGYFCLPLLYQDRFVGQMDCKTHRKQRRLEVKYLHFTPDCLSDDSLLPALADALVNALVEFKKFQNCNELSFAAITPKKLKQAIKSAFQ